jgi:hypothetical protein
VADNMDSPSRNISPSFRVELGYHLGHLISHRWVQTTPLPK